MNDNNIPQPTPKSQDRSSNYLFDPDGWPLDPTGRPFTRDEIITNAHIPLPAGVDPNHPYWQRRAPAALAAEKAQAEKKARQNRKRNARRRATRTLQSAVPLSRAELQAIDRGLASAELVDRVNGQEERAITLNGSPRLFSLPASSLPDQLEPQAIAWTRQGQTVWLEVH